MSTTRCWQPTIWRSLRDTTAHFDGVQLDAIRVESEVVARAWEEAPADLRSALELAASRIRSYHEAQRDAAVFGDEGLGFAEQGLDFLVEALEAEVEERWLFVAVGEVGPG